MLHAYYLVTKEKREENVLHINFKSISVISSDRQAKPECSVVQKAWLQGVVPAVVDAESSVQDRALEALDEVLLSHIKPYSASRHLDANQRLTWDLLVMLCHECRNLRLDQLHSVQFVFHIGLLKLMQSIFRGL